MVTPLHMLLLIIAIIDEIMPHKMLHAILLRYAGCWRLPMVIAYAAAPPAAAPSQMPLPASSLAITTPQYG